MARSAQRKAFALAAVALAVLVALAAAVAFARRGGETPVPVAAPVHVHGLGINPKDGALFIATHTGMWRLADSARRPTRVSESTQDTMGFTVVGPDAFLGSGHPDARDNLPPLLGLIESRDAGKTWSTVSLAGEADFHALRSAGTRVYGFDASGGRLMLSRDRGKTWIGREAPGAVLDLVVDPRNPTHLLVTGERGLLESHDEGLTWRALGVDIGLLAWPASNHLYRVDQTGAVSVSENAGKRWSTLGSTSGFPASVAATVDQLYVALHDGTIKHSSDGGRTWQVRSSAGQYTSSSTEPAERIEECTERMLRGENSDDASRAEVKDYVETTYCAPFERRGWVYDDGALAIDAQLWLESSGSEVCATQRPGTPARTVPCEELERGPTVLDCALLHHVRRSEVRTYVAKLERGREVSCDDGTALDALGVP